jgi:hypothetical protein
MFSRSVSMVFICMYMCMMIYEICMNILLLYYIYIYIYKRERERARARERKSEKEREGAGARERGRERGHLFSKSSALVKFC